MVRLLSRPDPVGADDEQGFSSVPMASAQLATSELIGGDDKGAQIPPQMGANDGAGKGMLVGEHSTFLEDDPYANSTSTVCSQWDSTRVRPTMDEIRQNDLNLDLNSVGGHDHASKILLLLRVHRALAGLTPSLGHVQAFAARHACTYPAKLLVCRGFGVGARCGVSRIFFPAWAVLTPDVPAPNRNRWLVLFELSKFES